MEPIVEQFMSVLEPCGLNLWGVVSAASYDRRAKPALRASVLAPGTRSIIVFASSGKGLWEAFLDDLRSNSDHLTLEQNPLDAYVKAYFGWKTTTTNAHKRIQAQNLTLSGSL